MRIKPRLAWFSPLNIEQKGSSTSAYWSDTLLPFLREEFEIHLYHDRFERYLDYPTHHYLSAFEHHKERPYNIFFYQLEDNKAANFTRIQVGINPGVALFHDLLFSTDGPEPILNSPWAETIKLFNDPDHPFPERERKYKKNGPLGYREAGVAMLPIFSSEQHHLEYQRNITHKFRITDQQSYFLPHPVSSRLSSARKVRSSRKRMGFLGTPELQHRTHKILMALAEVSFDYELIWLVNPIEAAQARTLLEEYDIKNCELIEGRSPERWSSIMPTIDIALHTLFSVYGQLGPYHAMSLMAGIPTIVTNFAGAEYLADDIVFKIMPGQHEAHELTHLFNSLLEKDDQTGLLAARRAQEFAREFFDAEVVAEDLIRVLISAAGSDFSREWEILEARARREAVEEGIRYLSAGSSDDCSSSPRNAWQRLLSPVFSELRWR